LSLLFLPKYSRAGASSRYRSFQYFPTIEFASLSFSVSPLFDEAYLAHKYIHDRARLWDVFRALFGRIWAVLTIERGSVVFIEYEVLPYFPALLERWMLWRGCKMVLDYDDALFHQYDGHRNSWVRRLLGNKISHVMRQATIVVAGNDYLADYARRAGASRVEVIPTVIDLSRYPLKELESDPNVFTIGWIGSPSTARYLTEIAPALADFCKGGRARVRLVGSGPIELKDVPFELIAWDENTEADEIRRFDVGIMPLTDEPWARGKCGFKLIQYMACGLPVVASPVGVNSEIVSNEVNGYLASTTDEWIRALVSLIADAELRFRMGAAGRKRVEEKYCLAITAPRFVELLKQCAA
jgi:glycosyltransferase involved in cell wall biosynthesis